MTRPRAILRFERLYLASTAAWLAGAALSWDERRRMIAASAALNGYEWLVPVGFVLVLAISLALWWATAHRGSLLARTAIAGIAVLSGVVFVLTVVGMTTGRALAWPTNLLQLTSSALGVAGTVMLFGDGARAWFGEPPATDAQA